MLNRSEGVMDQKLTPRKMEGTQTGVVQIEVGHHQLGDQSRGGQCPAVLTHSKVVDAIGVIGGHQATVTMERSAQIGVDWVIAFAIEPTEG